VFSVYHLFRLGRAQDAPKIVAVDLQPMAPIEGVTQIQGDITSAATAAEVPRRPVLVSCTARACSCANSCRSGHRPCRPSAQRVRAGDSAL